MPLPVAESPVQASAEGSADEPVVLIVDDDEVFRARLSRAFRQHGWVAHEAGDAETAVALAAELNPELILVDLRMPGRTGLELIPDLRARDPEAVIVVLTGYGSIATTLAATRSGANHYLSKPADVDQILAVYESLVSGESAADSIPAQVPSLARVEWEHIQRVLTDCGGNISQAARLLGIHRRSLQRKLAKYPPGV
ncbi:MAG TPA: response regulator [Bryobacteraceae bacterium]|nr:response regulator [Bryobacteraceae bacterium]